MHNPSNILFGREIAALTQTVPEYFQEEVNIR